MSTPVTIDVTVKRLDVSADASALQRLRNGLANRTRLNTKVAIEATAFTRAYLIKTPSHKTAEKLGATPTNFRAKQSKLVHSDADEKMAMVRMPRASGLGRAFHEITLVPKSGRKYLTIPASARTYGKRAGEFPPGTFAFTILGGRYPALMFEDGWTIAYWLRRSVTQKQDRTLIPSHAAYAEVGGIAARNYLLQLIKGS